MNYQTILLAAGEGQRAALGYNKVLYKINGRKELVLYSLEYFIDDPLCEKIVLVINKADQRYFKYLVNNPKVVFTFGGKERGESVQEGLKLIDSEYVIIHDAARPLIYKEDVYNLVSFAQETGGATLATKVYNTTCHIKDGFVDEYFSRHTLASVVTPQCFKRELLVKAYQENMMNREQEQLIEQELDAKYEQLRDDYQQQQQELLSLEEARKNKPNLWK